jgi:hypothetical protein
VITIVLERFILSPKKSALHNCRNYKIKIWYSLHLEVESLQNALTEDDPDRCKKFFNVHCTWRKKNHIFKATMLFSDEAT